MALKSTHKTAIQMAAIVVTMGSLAWASVPFYSWFCQVTGFGGTTAVSTVAPDAVLDQTITIRFDATVSPELQWSFKPVARVMDIRIGETGLAFYEATNLSDRPIAGSATYNVAPYEAGGFFTKIDCFCFTEQVLQPGETVMMPVTFYVDPEIVTDRDAKYVHHITLSYTFYETELPEDVASLSTAPVANVN